MVREARQNDYVRLSNALHSMCSDAHLPRLNWHALRHTIAHQLLSHGGNEGDLMALAGWKSRALVDHYAQSTQVKSAHNAARKLSLGDRV